MRVNVLEDIRVAVRLPAVIGFGIVTLLVTGLVAISTLSELEVGGPHDDRVMLRTQLLCDWSVMECTARIHQP